MPDIDEGLTQPGVVFDGVVIKSDRKGRYDIRVDDQDIRLRLTSAQIRLIEGMSESEASDWRQW